MWSGILANADVAEDLSLLGGGHDAGVVPVLLAEFQIKMRGPVPTVGERGAVKLGK